MLMGDRFYGSPALLEWLRSQGWGWRLRCKQDLLVFSKDGGETTLANCFARGEHMLTDIELTQKHARTNIAMLHEEGHAEPWIIALSEPPTLWRAHDYGLRWGIEAMFSDYKTRGFNLEVAEQRPAAIREAHGGLQGARRFRAVHEIETHAKRMLKVIKKKNAEKKASADGFERDVRVIIEGGHDFHPRPSPVFIEGGHPFS